MFNGGIMMKTNICWLALLAIGFLSGCAQMSPIASTLSDEELVANQHFIEPSNHDAVAKHYEDVAREMKAKLNAQKEQLEEYERHNYYYGRKGQNFRSHTWANIRHLENSVKENLEEAAMHRKMAQDQQRRDLSLIAK
ncbi:hypothetical protein BCL69_11652 [Nitrosomonas communis]|uniref:DUF4398 domain-containing protein n=3 Tax=Nitrosomonadaceae TaxID=206379 RepID=A0A5D3Y4T4_9PROT|nr:hypothetical protein BCL69_11652 [Nitrosomonas communis]